jgi:outer membrane receptor protein involved in Fe transport
VGINVDPYRKSTVDAWLTLNARIAYTLSKGTNISLMATNLLNTDKNYLVKNMAFPFDYKGPERQVSMVLKTTF